MTKNDLIERLAEDYELTKSYARQLVDSMLDMITDAAQKGEEVALFLRRYGVRFLRQPTA